jgi:hypothetical protein
MELKLKKYKQTNKNNSKNLTFNDSKISLI